MYIDTHVHLYPGVSPADLLRAARGNLPDPQAPLALMLTERSDDHAFEALAAEDVQTPGFTVQTLADPNALRIDMEGRSSVYLIAGRQIATAERLEVLALGTRSTFKDGESLPDSVARVQSCGALPVIPWAFGKWWFKRGGILKAYLEGCATAPLALADSAMRPGGMPPSPLFGKARAKGWPVLAGSDPLPQPGGERAAGMYGIQLNDTPSEIDITQTILTAIQTKAFTVYGRRRHLITVLQSLR